MVLVRTIARTQTNEHRQINEILHFQCVAEGKGESEIARGTGWTIQYINTWCKYPISMNRNYVMAMALKRNEIGMDFGINLSFEWRTMMSFDRGVFSVQWKSSRVGCPQPLVNVQWTIEAERELTRRPHWLDLHPFGNSVDRPSKIHFVGWAT